MGRSVDGNGSSGSGVAQTVGLEPTDGIVPTAGFVPADGTADVSVTLWESAFTFETPDLQHTFAATVRGDAANQVTWSSSDSYVASVDAQGVVTSVSGGQAEITATSTLDPAKTATVTVRIAEPNRARAISYVDAKTVASGPVQIFTAGDSLTRTYVASSSDQAGWGQVLGQFFSSDVSVDNSISNGGRSSRSFYNEVGRWDLIKTRLAAARAAGTPAFVFIMFGHNDQKKVTDTDGADFLTFASQNQNGTVAGTYYDYLERYVVETRELGAIPVLLTPFVREYLEGTPSVVSIKGQHDITVPYDGEITARGDYPAAARAVAEKHDVPLVDITAWSTRMVGERAAANTLDYVYIATDQTHVRELGALLMAQEVARQLSEQGILSGYSRSVSPRLMIDASGITFGGLYVGNSSSKSFRITPFGDVTGTIDIGAAPGYDLSLDGVEFASALRIPCDAAYAGNIVTVRLSATDSVPYNADLRVTHSVLTPDYGNTPPNAQPGVIALTGNGKVPLSGTPADVVWAMLSGTDIAPAPVVTGTVEAGAATLVGLVNKDVGNAAARFDVVGGAWPAEGARNETRYVEFTLNVPSGTFTIDTISLDAGTGGGSNVRWEIAYALAADFSQPTVLQSAGSGVKDTLVNFASESLGVNVEAGSTLYLRVYPYSTAASASGKSLMLANVQITGVTNP
jgi:lysophospholipase L1-like esterase